MKVLVSWLRDFVDVTDTPEAIARTMSVRGFAVESIDPVGTDGDAVIDFEVTANRPDCMSVMGMAREVATAYGLNVRRPAVRGRDGHEPESGPGNLRLTSLAAVERGDIDVVIERADLCPRYSGAVADVTIGPSPDWMQQRLLAAGVRPINNVVDVTNYVLIETGQPMHAFDLRRIGGERIRVRAAKPGETLRTLDGQQRTLTPDMLVIADNERAVAVAGVMGGAESEVVADTTAIVLESACFDPLAVRRTGRALGLKTEASMRFERGADPRMAVTAMERACALLEITGTGQARGSVVDRHPRRAEPTVLALRRARIEALLGAAVPDGEVRRILDGLGFAVRDAEYGWDVTVPPRRVDVKREVDLIEEVARHHGFDALPVTFPAPLGPAPALDPRIARARQLRGLLTAAGFFEAVTFGFVAERPALPFAPDGDLVGIANPLSESFAVLRPSALPGLVDAVAHNRHREQQDVRLFEVGACFSKTRGERRMVALTWTGAVTSEHWSGAAREADFFDMKGVVERLGDALRVQLAFEEASLPWLTAGRAATVLAGGAPIGAFGQLSPARCEQHGLSATDVVLVAELDLDAAERAALRGDQRVVALPRFPSMTRDLSVLIDDALAARAVLDTVRGAAPDTLVRVGVFDRYQGKGVPDGRVSLSLRLTFRSAERTLTDAEIQQATEAVVAALVREHGAVQR